MSSVDHHTIKDEGVTLGPNSLLPAPPSNGSDNVVYACYELTNIAAVFACKPFMKGSVERVVLVILDELIVTRVSLHLIDIKLWFCSFGISLQLHVCVRLHYRAE
jgi:hypothetical protein